MSIAAAPVQAVVAGQPLVRWISPGTFRGVPALSADRIVVRTTAGDVVAFNAQSGAVLWRHRLARAPGFVPAGRLVATPAVVIAGDDGLEAFDAADGGLVWTTKIGEGVGAGIQVGGMTKELVFTGSYVSRLFAIEISTGKLRWAADLGFGGEAAVFSPQVDTHGVVATFAAFRERTGGVVAFDLSGHLVWKTMLEHPMRPGVIGPAVLAGDLVLAVDRAGVIHALDRRSGRACWTVPDARSRAPVEDFRPLAVSGATLVAGSLTGEVIAYDVATRAERWRAWPVQASVAFGLGADDQTVWIPYVSGQVVGLDVVTGRQRWRVGDSGEGFRWLPLVRGADMFLSGVAGGLVAFRRPEEH